MGPDERRELGRGCELELLSGRTGHMVSKDTWEEAGPPKNQDGWELSEEAFAVCEWAACGARAERLRPAERVLLSRLPHPLPLPYTYIWSRH